MHPHTPPVSAPLVRVDSKPHTSGLIFRPGSNPSLTLQDAPGGVPLATIDRNSPYAVLHSSVAIKPVIPKNLRTDTPGLSLSLTNWFQNRLKHVMLDNFMFWPRFDNRLFCNIPDHRSMRSGQRRIHMVRLALFPQRQRHTPMRQLIAEVASSELPFIRSLPEVMYF